MVYILLLINVILLVSGQVLWKIAVSSVSTWNFQSAFSVIISPFFISGVLLYIFATGIWIYILSKLPLSIAYPIQSICYVLGAIAAYFIFKEDIQLSQWLGMLVIILGVFLIAR